MSAARVLQLGLFLAGLVSGYGFATAQVVMCVDKDGHKEYAQKCPEGTQQKAVKIYPGVGNAPDQPSLSQQDAAFRERQIENEQNDKKAAADAKNKAVACQSARDRLSQLETIGRLHYSADSAQSGKYLTDEDRAREIVSTQGLIEKYCSR